MSGVMDEHAKQLSENVKLVRDALEDLVTQIEEHKAHRFGPEIPDDLKPTAGDACVKLARGDRNKARALYKEIMIDCGNYMPEIVARALVRAADAWSLMPDIEAPEVG